jgi:DNA-binding NarL/FixJ family response regulator
VTVGVGRDRSVMQAAAELGHDLPGELSGNARRQPGPQLRRDHGGRWPRLAAELALMAEGRSNQAIAGQLMDVPRTVETHVGSIFSKLGLAPAAEDHRRVLAVLACLRH